MARILLSITLFASLATGGLAQVVLPESSEAPIQYVEVSQGLISSEQGQAALDAYHEIRALRGPSVAAKVLAARPDVGDRADFDVRTNLLESTSTWETSTFELIGKGTRFHLWLSVDILTTGLVTEEAKAEVMEALSTKTPETSVNTAKGIIENNDAIYGSPPDYDGDRIVDILLVEIIEGGSANGNQVVLGFFDPNDINPNARADQSNQADVVYLDPKQGISSSGDIDRLIQTAAHEYQHLIHANYDSNEDSFLSEGYAEFAPIANGYSGTTIDYLTNRPYGYNVPLFSWNTGSNVGRDYERGGLLMSYIADQFGPDMVGRISRNTTNGALGISSTLEISGESRTMKELVMDFHTANLINDKSVNPRFGYGQPQRNGLTLTATEAAEQSSTTPPTQVTIEPGGADYVEWREVEDFAVDVSIATTEGLAASRVAFRVVATRESGTVETRDFLIEDGEQVFDGTWQSIVLILVQTDLARSSTRVEYKASWTNTDVFTETIKFDNGSVASYFLVGNTANSAFSTRVEKPAFGDADVVLNSAELPTYFFSQFQGGPPSTVVRDLRFSIWEDSDGAPGDLLFGLTLEDTRAHTSVGGGDDLKPFVVDLSGYEEQMRNLPDVFHVGARNNGSDENVVIIAVSNYATENRSHISRNAGTWTPMWEVVLSDGAGTLRDRIAPVRANFRVDSQPVPNEEGVPELVTALTGNYPNPFTDATTLTFSKGTSDETIIEVFDLTGRRVHLETLLLPPGDHSLSIDSKQWASGTYLLALTTDKQRLTRKLSLIR